MLAQGTKAHTGKRRPASGLPAAGLPTAGLPTAEDSPTAGRARESLSVAARMIGAALGPGGTAGACIAACLHSTAGMILAVAIVTVSLMTVLLLVILIVFGTTRSHDRIFRLLRWIRDKEEPAGAGNPL